MNHVACNFNCLLSKWKDFLKLITGSHNQCNYGIILEMLPDRNVITHH